MKYLKEFRKINLGYEQISDDERDQLLYGGDLGDDINHMWLKFTEREIEIIEKFFNNNWEFIGGSRGYYMANKLGWQYQLPIGGLASVVKLEDSWYYVSIKKSKSQTYPPSNDMMSSYKCDDIEGLINCLENEVTS